MGELNVRLDAAPAGSGIALRFVLEGTGSATVMQPLIPLALEAVIGGAPVTVEVPAYDMGVRAVSVELPAEVPCPVTLSFGESAGGRFQWTLQHPPAPVELTATVEVDGEPYRTAPISVDITAS